MDRPLHLDARVAPRSPARRIVAIGTACLIEAAVVYAVASGLGARAISMLPQTLKVDIIKAPPPKETTPPPPQAVLVKPTLPAVPPPEIKIQSQPERQQITVVQSLHPTQPAPVMAPPAPPAAPPKPAAPSPTPVQAIASTHTIPPYPVTPRRLGQEGTVLLNITVNTDGSVADASVAKSSGDTELDEAAVEWVKAHWRYKPATQNGAPVIARSEAQVVFNLKNAEQAG